MSDISEREVEKAALSYSGISSVKEISKYSSGAARETFRVEASSGNFVVYICEDTSEAYEERFSKEEKLLELVNNKTEIPTQKILKSDFTKREVPYLFYIAEEVEGYDPIDRYKWLPRKEKNNIVHEAGKHLGELHREVKFKDAGELGLEEGEIKSEGLSWDEFLERWTEKYVEQFKDTPFEDLQEKAYRFFEEHRELAEGGENVCLHFDVTPDNLIIKNGGIEALIDWEKAISGRPEWDLAYTRIHMIYRWFETEEINEELEKEFFKGYSEEYKLKPGWRNRLIFFSMIWNFKSMAKFEKHFQDASEQEKQEETEFFRDLFMRNFEDLEKTVEEEMKY